MKVLVTGASGQLGCELRRTAPPANDLVVLTSGQLDVCDAEAVMRAAEAHRPEVIINAAAYTAVDKAESEKEKTFAVNTGGAANLARAASCFQTRLIHISTDFVFNGNNSRPYLPTDHPDPLGVYGASKLEGEHAVMSQLDSALIVRTSWLYASRGQNFVQTMLRVMRERDRLDVVFDQIGSPTWAHSLAEAIWKLSGTAAVGIYHWADAGVTSWYDFAVAIQEEGTAAGLLTREVPIMPIKTVDYPTPAIRPAYSVLDATSTWEAIGCEPVHWRRNLRRMFREMKESANE